MQSMYILLRRKRIVALAMSHAENNRNGCLCACTQAAVPVIFYRAKPAPEEKRSGNEGTGLILNIIGQYIIIHHESVSDICNLFIGDLKSKVIIDF